MEGQRSLGGALKQAAMECADKAALHAEQGSPGGAESLGNAAKALTEAYIAVAKGMGDRG